MPDSGSICNSVNEFKILIPSTENVPMTLNESNIKKEIIKPPKKPCIPYPTHLPKLTDELQQIIRNGMFYKKQASFISFWAANLAFRTGGTPTKTDYHNYALTIVDSYPDLKGGMGGCVSCI